MKKTFAKKPAAIFGALALAGVLAAGAFSAAAFAGHRHGDRSEQMAERIAERLSLDDAQEERLEDMLKDAKKKRKALRREAKEKIRAVILQDSPAKKDVMEILDMRRAKREEMRAYLAEQFIAFHATLDKDQREELADIAPRMIEKMSGKRGRGKNKRGYGRRGHDERGGRHHDRGERHHDRDDRDDRGRHDWD